MSKVKRLPKHKLKQKLNFKDILANRYFQLVALFFFLISIRFFPLIFQNKTLFFGDNYSLMVPGKIFTANWLKKGVLPLWNPNILGGLPWIGDVNQSVLYPSTLLFVFLDPADALNLTVLAHLFLSMLGMYLVVKSLKISNQPKVNHSLALLAAALWIFSTQFTNSINNLTVLQSLTWMPFIVHYALKIHHDKKAKFLFALFVFLQFLGGYPPLVIYSILTGVIFSAFFYFKDGRKKIFLWLKDWLTTAVLTVALSAVVWMPFLEALLQSTRMIQTETQATSGSLHPPEIIKFFIPYFFDHAGAGMRWGPGWNTLPNVAAYFTWFVLLVVFSSLFKKRKDKSTKFFMIFSLATLLLSFGKYLPGFSVIQIILPIFKFARGPSLLLVITTFVVCVWLAFIFPKIRISKKWLRILTGGSLLVFIASLILFFVSKDNFPFIWQLINDLTKNAFIKSAFHTFEKDQIIANVILENLVVNSFLFFLSLIVWQKSKQPKSNKNLLLLIVILCLDLIYNNQSMLSFAPKDIYPSLAEQSAGIQAQAFHNPNYRFLIRNYNYPYTDFGAYWEALSVRQPFSDSYINEEELKDFRNLKRFADGYTPDWNMAYDVASINAYTTLMPQDTYKEWTGYYLNIGDDCKNPEIENVKEGDRQTAVVSRIRCLPKDISINNLPEIQLDNQLLKKWAVKYYLVDNWFYVTEDLSQFEKVMEKDWWTVYELEALARFRYEDNTAVFAEEDFVEAETGENDSWQKERNLDSKQKSKFQETPNSLSLNFYNDNGYKELIIADRYDKNWRAWVNGEEVAVEEFEGMRKVKIEEGENYVKLQYRSKSFKQGMLISQLMVLAVIIKIILDLRKKFS